MVEIKSRDSEDDIEEVDCDKMDTNHNRHDDKFARSVAAAASVVVNAANADADSDQEETEKAKSRVVLGDARADFGEEDVAMASEGDSDSLRDH